MTQKSLVTWISGDTAIAGTSRSRLLRLLRRSDFSGRRKKPELLPLNAADRASPRPLTKIQDKETITIHRPGRSTYPEEKSVLTSGTTPPIAAPLLVDVATSSLSPRHASSSDGSGFGVDWAAEARRALQAYE